MKNLARIFFIIAGVYLLFTISWVFIFVNDPAVFLKHDLTIAVLIFKSRLTNSYYSSAVLVLLSLSLIYQNQTFDNWKGRIHWFGQFGVTLFLVTIASIMVSAAFTAFETSFMAVRPFYADPFLAKLDRWLLCGRDAWAVAHDLFPKIDSYWIDFFYFWTWNALFSMFTLVLFFLDKNLDRVARFLLLYVFSSLVIGNVMAFAFQSVGPVYYDFYYGKMEFSALTNALNYSGVSDSIVGHIQGYLGELFKRNDDSRPSDIAAFPSVHVSTVMFVTLYVVERLKIAGIIMIPYSLAILFLSVYTGYHWLVDGIASILIMIAANSWLKRSRFVSRLAG